MNHNNSYHINSEQDETCLDKFENHIKSHHKHYDMSGHVCRIV